MYSGKIAMFTPEGLIQIIEEKSPDPNPDEILVRLHLAGVCGSDVHRVAGDIPRPNHPICFGHEAVGIIQKIGQNIKTDRGGAPIIEGDFLYWCPSTPCRNCQECIPKNPLQCKFLNWPVTAGGQMLLDSETFGCAMPTALRGFRRLPEGAFTSATDVVIQGCGPVGLACALLSKLAGARTITIIGDPEHRLDAARALDALRKVAELL
ncbi:hypothetical protein N7520_003053 [Penicillium odoratum]|uniref:uncharacterized protein n=1 Tax=Penicillium odoratum TaxID=1167516 RepID=UPI0025470D93|nr:uncharacterized protein N7520_003053 [Penicillium odoratum]KAJ5772524.1 hypothetical protein N7520_003053 [Penicillium odoratum]